VTEECKGRITGKEVEGEGMQVVVGMGGVRVGDQSVLSTGHGDEDGEDVEDVRLISLFAYDLRT
jgi:hypothetical protein